MRRTGFTLFEVAVSTLLVAIAILAVLLTLPMGVRTQEHARYRIHAAALLNDLMVSFVQSDRNAIAQTQTDIDDDGIGSSFLYGFRFLGSVGQFDLERVAVSAGAQHAPVPLEIARRLDSPNDEIQRVLDAGGHIHYQIPGAGDQGLVTGASRETSPEMQRLVWAVVGPAQQNLLPNHPTLAVPKELYPFPPQARFSPEPRRYGYNQRFIYWHDVDWPGFPDEDARKRFVNELEQRIAQLEGTSPRSADQDRELGEKRKKHSDCTSTWSDIVSRDRARSTRWCYWKNVEPPRSLVANASDSGGGAQEDGKQYQANNWEWLAYTDEKAGKSADDSRWIAGLPQFRRLVTHHWTRISHQLSRSSGGGKTRAGAKPPFEFDFWEDRDGKVGPKDEWWDSTSAAAGGYRPVTELEGGFGGVRGLPAPANGLPDSTFRGTDILYEDHETCLRFLESQLRLGLPSLERRVMYRTAALALWAKVASSSPIRIHSSPAEDLLASRKDPNVADLVDALDGASLDPLLRVIDPPNPREIHPAQILALSYLAHAAMLVTGYKPPFVDDRDTVWAEDDVSLQPQDESLPWKALEQDRDTADDPKTGKPKNDDTQYYLWEPFKGGATTDLLPKQEAEDSMAGDAKSQIHWTDAKDPATGAPLHGKPVRYRRMTGPVLNPYPPPYADRGAFDHAGKRMHKASWEKDARGNWLRRIRPADYDASLRGKDSEWARNAHETCMRWTMAYLSENPYDLVVPRPLNRPTMTDRPLFGLDLFTRAGDARRPEAKVGAWYPVIWGSDRFVFGSQGQSPIYVSTKPKLDAYMASPEYQQAYPYFRHGPDVKPPYPFGIADPRADVDGKGGTQNAWHWQREWHNRRNQLHDIAQPANETGPWNVPTSPRRDRFWWTRGFDPRDRCRQIVVWAVDWKSYEDAETVPSAPIDVAQFGRDWRDDREKLGKPIWTSSHADNPERKITWANPRRDATLTRLPSWSIGIDSDVVQDKDFPGIYYRGRDEQWSPYWTLGYWGADRDGDGKLDRGTVKATARMRAIEVARFVYYDPVAWMGVQR